MSYATQGASAAYEHQQSVSAYKAVHGLAELYTQHQDTVRRNIDQLRRRPPKAAAHPWQFKQPARECPRDPARGAPSSANFATHQHTTLSVRPNHAHAWAYGTAHNSLAAIMMRERGAINGLQAAGSYKHSRRAHQGTRQPHGRHAPASAQTTRRTTKRHGVPCAQHATVSQLLSHRPSTDAQSV